jgi:hypothetical protein
MYWRITVLFYYSWFIFNKTNATFQQCLHMEYIPLNWSDILELVVDFLDRGLLLTKKLLNQGFLLVKLKLSLLKFYGLHYDLVNRYGISVSQMTMDMFHLS